MFWEALPTALVASFSPTTLVTVAWLLSRQRARRLAFAFLAAAATVTLAVGFLVVGLLAGTGLDDSTQHPAAPPALDLGLGLVTVGFAALLARHPRAEKPHVEKPHRHEPKVLTAVILGLALGTPSPMYILALHTVSQGGVGAVVRGIEVVVLAAIVLLFAEIPIATYLFAPERTAAGLRDANAWLSRNGRLVLVLGAAVVGCYFTVKGIVGLV
jgi:hypothetical protein